MLQNTEEAVEQNLEPDGRRMGTVQHQTGDVEHNRRLHRLDGLSNRTLVKRPKAQLVESCKQSDMIPVSNLSRAASKAL